MSLPVNTSTVAKRRSQVAPTSAEIAATIEAAEAAIARSSAARDASDAQAEADADADADAIAATAVSSLVTMTKALLSLRETTSELKGSTRARASQLTKDNAAVILASILSNPSLRSARCAVKVKATLRGESEVQVVTVSCIDIVRAVAFGGPVIGSARLA